MKPGIKTTEFWTSAITTGLAILAEVFHTHVALNVPKTAVIAAGAVNAAYAISRAITKHGFVGAIENEIGYEHVTTQTSVAGGMKTVNKTVPVNATSATPVTNPVVTPVVSNPEANGL